MSFGAPRNAASPQHVASDGAKGEIIFTATGSTDERTQFNSWVASVRRLAVWEQTPCRSEQCFPAEMTYPPHDPRYPILALLPNPIFVSPKELNTLLFSVFSGVPVQPMVEDITPVEVEKPAKTQKQTRFWVIWAISLKGGRAAKLDRRLAEKNRIRTHREKTGKWLTGR